MNPPINIPRSLGALFIGFLVLAALDTICTALFIKFSAVSLTAALTSQQTLALLAIKVFAGLSGGYVAATLAGSRRWQHAIVLALCILSVGVLGLIAMSAVPRSAYTTYALFLSPLSIVIGGWLRHLQSASKTNV
ncbi:MAG TPA: hypothetical protein VFZ34_16980 [Blastocatellia bacterium]|nr:hypothetical protein [Blastocatellia bacterium]